jgi:sterol 3beta-glucosyltransferase/vancomycin aglycone glucosyltransferase
LFLLSPGVDQRTLMKIGIQTWGSEGDVRPFFALAGGLSAAGHDVTLAVTEIPNRRFARPSEQTGFAIRQVGHIALDKAKLKQLAADAFKEWNPIKKGDILINHFLNPVVEDMFAAGLRLCKVNELVIGHFFVYPLKVAARRLRRPFVMMFTAPLLPSRHHPPVGLPSLGPWGNPLSWKLFEYVLQRHWKPSIDRFYLREGLKPEKSLLQGVFHSPHLNLVAVSPRLFPPPPDWANRYHLCGYMNAAVAEDSWRMSPGLEDFLSTGDPPVYMTFGSMIGSDPSPGEITLLLIEAARLARCRAIIQSNWEDLNGLPESPHIFRITRAPHARIFPRCAAVVHHGGTGTTQAATLAGCPSVVVEHAADQPLWGSILKRKGIAPKVLHRRSLSAAKLAGGIRTVLDSPRMAASARAVGAGMRREDGVARAVALIEACREGALQ